MIKPAVFSILFLVAVTVSARETVTIRNYQQLVDFSGMKVVLLEKGDNPGYREPSLDDSSWNVVSLPSDWGELYPDYNGICWYRIHILFPYTLPKSALGVSLGVITDADEAYFNGQLIGKSGRIGPPRVSAYDKKRIYQLPTSLIRPGGDNVLAVRVAGLFAYSNGPYTGSFVLGDYSGLQKDEIYQDIFDLVFIVVYFVVAVYFLFFFIRRSSDRENLLFALFCLGMGIYFFLRMQMKYYLGFDFFIMKKTEYLVLCWLVYLMMEFLMFYFKKKHNIIHYIFLGITGVSFIVLLVTTDYNFWDNYNQYVMIPSWSIGVIVVLYILMSKIKSDWDARYMLIALLILLGTLINDILLNMNAYQFIRLTNYGFVFFIASIGIILSNRFVRLHNEVAFLNVNLEKKVVERTRELNETVSQLAAAKAETDNILSNVKEGIFLIDGEFMIGNNYSRVMEEIFETADVGGKNFISFISPFIETGEVESVKDFLEIALTRKLPEKRLMQLNPLEDIEVHVQKDVQLEEKFLNFAFSRIEVDEHNTFLLSTVRDVTERKKLAQKVAESEKKAESEMKLLFGIIHLNPVFLKGFLDESRSEIKEMEDNLKNAQFEGNYKDLLNRVYRSVHSIKGNAGMLGLENFEQKAHVFEEKIRELYEMEELNPVLFVDLLYMLVDLKEGVKDVETLLEKIINFRATFDTTHYSELDTLRQSLKSLAERVAEREKKKVGLEMSRFVIPFSDEARFNAVKKILIQLVKNAVSHGIETTDTRIQKSKPEKGNIVIESSEEDGRYVLTCSDDGQGLRLEVLKQKALASGKYSEAEIESWPKEKLAQLIFDQGISTHEAVTIDAGRGVGLNVVKHEVSKLKGKVSIEFARDKYMRFRISIPVKEK
ncbi:MAG: Hpt domain-containing protein [Spirochaetales bacterium]|nr:Hpt domain-containing protein [Spirochaetales bacterium]